MILATWSPDAHLQLEWNGRTNFRQAPRGACVPMKVFDLVCAEGHRFEGWFASAERYAEQCATGTVHCPLCDSSEIRREPSAPRIGSSGAAPSATAGPSRPQTPASIEATMLGHLRRFVAKTEDVGPRFAEEARRIHYEEVPARPIRGTTSDRERRALHDEGIETLTIAMPPALTETLQ